MSKTKTLDKTRSRPSNASLIKRAAHARPLTEADFKRMNRTPTAKIIRRALDLTQEEFAARFHIPLGTLRDWEQGRARPDAPTRVLLAVIAKHPEAVEEVLSEAS